MSHLIATLKAYAKFAQRLRGFLKNPTTLEETITVIQEQMANREANFLEVLRMNVFSYARSPYIPLFERAGITYDDVEKMLGRQSLEDTLGELYDAGIYVTFEEAKGREPIRRGDLVIPVQAGDFDSPDIDPVMFGQTGGSTGVPTRNRMDLRHIAYQSKYMMLDFETQGILNAPTGFWRGVLPDPSGVANILRMAHMGQPAERWFTPTRIQDTNLSYIYMFLTYMIIIISRINGFRFPMPEFVPLNDPLKIAQWAVDAVKRVGACVVRISVSKAVRISATAQEHGLDLKGVVFHGAGEPPTPAKVQAIEASGARYVPRYAFSEVGTVGIACGNPKSADDVHLMSNHIALIQRPVEIFDQTVNGFCMTTLFPYVPKTLINVHSDDYGVVEERECGCLLHQLGMHTHISDVRSYRKLTSEGITLVGSDMVRIIEEVLPAQFGGGPLDYQLVEEEGADSMTKMVLYVDPSVQLTDEKLLADTFLQAMRESVPAMRLAQAEFRHADVVEIRRQEPIRTSRNKHFPIRTLHRQG